MLPISTIYCDALRSLLSALLVSSDRRNTDFLFGRALGRVVAHELYHVLTGEKHHADHGLVQEQLTPEELLSRTLRFQPEQVQELRAKLVPTLIDSYWDALGRGERTGYRTYVLSGCTGCHGLEAQGTAWGPELRGQGKTYDAPTLERWLTDRRSEMYRKAKTLHLLWPSLKANEVKSLVEYLGTLERSPFQPTSGAR